MNGAAENFVNTFKNKIKKIVKGGEKLDDAINLFLFDYRSIKHCTTEESPAFLLFKRELRTRFDLLKARGKRCCIKKSALANCIKTRLAKCIIYR